MSSVDWACTQCPNLLNPPTPPFLTLTANHWTMSTDQILLSLLTIVASGVAASYVTYRFSARRVWLESRRAKLEEFYLAFTGFSQLLGSHALPYMHAMATLIEYDEANDIAIRNSGDKPQHWAQLSMLAAIHFPELEAHVNELVQAREKWNDLRSAFKREYKRVGPHLSPCLPAAQELAKELDLIDERFDAAVRQLAKQLARGLRAGA